MRDQLVGLIVNRKMAVNRTLKVILLGILLSIPICRGESSTCLTIYKEGGAPAVFRSPKCPRWKLPNYCSRPPTSALCQSALRLGRRKSQEDRTLCALDIRIPFPVMAGFKEVVVGIVAVFDGHNGAEASEMASKLLLEYFLLHTYFLLDATYSAVFKKSTRKLSYQGGHETIFQMFNRDKEPHHQESDTGRSKYSLPAVSDDHFHLEILKEALLRAIHDIDATFSKEASNYNLNSGSTATVILMADDQILVANIGDSKGFLCSETFQPPAEAKATILRLYMQKRQSGTLSRLRGYGNFKTMTSNAMNFLSVKELTRDHHPDRDDERSRVETAGGQILEWGGVARINGQLAISRAIGDLSFKSYGVISAPEITDWQHLTANDSYLIAASDGLFERLSLEDVCDLLWEVQNKFPIPSRLSSSCAYSLADCIVTAALERGSTDNVAAVVVPLASLGLSQDLAKDIFVGEEGVNNPTLYLQNLISEYSGGFSRLLEFSVTYRLEPWHRFQFLVPELELSPDIVGSKKVKKKHRTPRCFYLYENLDEFVDYTLQNDTYENASYVDDCAHAHPETLGLDQHHGGLVNLYNHQNFCLNLEKIGWGSRQQCSNSEVLISFFSLIESIPFHGSAYEYSVPDLRYILKKRFGHGSYGEVWLAFHWNCGQERNSLNWINKNSSFSTHNCEDSPPEDNLFILKRIMVERGTAVYLSGLREKYFGEVFLNASTCLGDFQEADLVNSVLEKSYLDLDDIIENNKSRIRETGNIFSNSFRRSPVYEEGLDHIARYVESFESQSNQVWLVFRHEGTSLSKLIYTVEELEGNSDEDNIEKKKHVQILRPSKWWHWLKTTEAGKEEMRNLIWQLLKALKACHDRNIIHRDIKPENMVICFQDQDCGKCTKGSPSGDQNLVTKMRLIDFGSAIDEFTLKHLYGSHGPSRAEQTHEYTPPEALLNSSWFLGPTSTTLKYDMWSVGVVTLELILGSPNVFQISALTQTLLDQHLEGWNEDLKELAYKLRSFMELCILIPTSSRKSYQPMYNGFQLGGSPASWKCSEEVFSHHIRSRDPLKLGFPNVSALRLVRQLLLWDPEDRLSVDEALQHPYFQPPPNA